MTAEGQNSQFREQPTPGRAIRRQCRSCLSLLPASKGYDCLNAACKCYAAMPYRGRAMPASLASEAPLAVQTTAALEAECAPIAKQRPSLALVHAYCRECRQGAQEDCGCPECPFYPWLRYQPGGATARRRSAPTKPFPRKYAHTEGPISTSRPLPVAEEGRSAQDMLRVRHPLAVSPAGQPAGAKGAGHPLGGGIGTPVRVQAGAVCGDAASLPRRRPSFVAGESSPGIATVAGEDEGAGAGATRAPACPNSRGTAATLPLQDTTRPTPHHAPAIAAAPEV